MSTEAYAFCAEDILDRDLYMADECDNGLGTQIEQLREECAKEGAWLQNRSHQIIEKFHRNKGAAESAQFLAVLTGMPWSCGRSHL